MTRSATLQSTATASQKLVVDYTVHYVKQSGATSPEVFKLKTLTLAPGQSADLLHRRAIRNFTTRRHHCGRHRIELTINRDTCGSGFFDLR